MPKFTEINKRIFSLMEENKITAYKLSKDCNIPEGTISQVKQNKYGFSVEQIIKISEYFKISLDWLCKGEIKDRNKEEREITALQNKIFEYQSYIKKMDSEIAILNKVSDAICKRKKIK